MARTKTEPRRLRLAFKLWGELTLAGIVFVSWLVIWHLVRRGRLVRDRLGPPRSVELPDVRPDDPEVKA